jgi:hypothetical protein
MMTTTPWKIDGEIKDEIHLYGADSYGVAICSLYSDPMDDETKENAAAIIAAVNGTYGIGINPAFVGELYLALTGLMQDIRNKPNDTRYNIHMKIAKDAIEKAKL